VADLFPGALAMMQTIAFLNHIGPMEIAIILGVGLLLFGRRLPEVGRSLGRSIVEFKRGLNSVGDEVEEASKKTAKAELTEAETRTVARNPEVPSSAKTV
jgi:sec-independent protein translocase protein TatA